MLMPSRHYIFRLSLLLLLPLAVACQESSTTEHATTTVAPPTQASTPPPVLVTKPSQELIQRFRPFLQGAWVNAAYLAAVQKTKSPILCAEQTGEISEIHLSWKQVSGDSLVAGLGLNNHEGGQVTVYFRPGRSANALPTNYKDYDKPGNFADISYRLTGRDTILVFTHYSEAGKVVRRATYQRISGVIDNTDMAEALNLSVNQLLFTGRYTGTDSTGRPVQVQFTTDGRVRGLPGFTTYYTTTDFGGGPGNDIDNIMLDHTTKHARTLSFEHRADTLRLYQTTLLEPTDEPETLIRGRLLYKLVRR
jgi:hypothetical protein